MFKKYTFVVGGDAFDSFFSKLHVFFIIKKKHITSFETAIPQAYNMFGAKKMRREYDLVFYSSNIYFASIALAC
jgi:hypothetical protein